MKRRKIVFFIEDLKLGGIETSFLNKLKKLDLNRIDVTIVLEHKRGVFVDKLPANVKVIDYNLSECRFVLWRKIKNRLKYIWHIITNYHKYDIAINETAYSHILTNLALKYGKKTYLWVHFNYTERWEHDQYINFFTQAKFKEYDKLIFVSERALKQYQQLHFSNQEQCCCYNLIPDMTPSKNGKIKKPAHKFVFLNVSRQIESQKRLSRIIKAAKILNEKYDNFVVWLVGDGVDSEKYQEMIHEYHLEDVIKMWGFQKDPGPYYEQSDAVLLVSDFEGFPVVYCECMKFGKHLLTTDVSDGKYLFNDTQITITNKDVKDIAAKMAQVMNRKIKVEPFDIAKFNQDIIQKYEDIFYK